MPKKILKETDLDNVPSESSTDPESVSPPLPEEKKDETPELKIAEDSHSIPLSQQYCNIFSIFKSFLL